MKKLSVLLIVLLVASLLVMGISCTKQAPAPTTAPAPAPAPEKPVVLRFASPFPADDPHTLGPMRLADRFKERTGGKYVIEVHPGESLVKFMEQFDGVRTRTIEMAICPIGPHSGYNIAFAAAEFPMLYNNVQAEVEGLKSLLPLYDELTEKSFNQKVLACWSVIPLEVVCAKSPINTLEDWKGKLMMSISPQLGLVIEAMGAGSVSITFTELYTSVQKGVVDGAVVSTEQDRVFKMWEIAKYVTVCGFVPASAFVTINLDAWKSLPADVQNILVEESQRVNQEVNDYAINGVVTNKKTLADNGMVVYDLPKAERDRWLEKLGPYRQKLLTDMGDFGQKLMKIAEDANNKYPY